MPFSLHNVVKSPFRYGAIVSLDPAGVGPSGVAVRVTAPLGDITRNRLQVPGYLYQGHIMNPVFIDELSCFLARNLGANQRALLVTEDCAYRSYKIARHIGRAIGTLESTLHYLGWSDPDDTLYVAPSTWRKAAYGKVAKGRDATKAQAVATVEAQYHTTVKDDLAEAILINDYAVLCRAKDWK